MPNYAISREALQVGIHIRGTAQPSLGKLFKLVAVHPVGYDKASGRSRAFIEYDFVEVGSGQPRQGFTLNYINRYFCLP